MIDVQNQKDEREIPLQKAGVKGLRYPIQVLDRAHKIQHTTASADLFVNLPHHFKGTHMSRFVEIFRDYAADFSMKNFLAMLEKIRENLDAERSFGRVSFPFFIEKKAPVSGQAGMMCYECAYEGCSDAQSKTFYVSVEVPVMTVCPCSKAISEYGAHNQRGIVRIRVCGTSFFWLEDIILLAEKAASSGVYSLLKRSDEKFVTESAYDNPRFVEDVVREVYAALKRFPIEPPFGSFTVEAENFESIHNHNAYACAEYNASVQKC